MPKKITNISARLISNQITTPLVSDNGNDDIYLLRRKLHLEFDVWSSRAGDSYLRLMINYMSIEKDLKLVTLTLGVIPFNNSHTAINTKQLIESEISKFGFDYTYVASGTMDTTPSSFNTLDTVDIVAQIPCFAHKSQLFLKHSIEKCVELNTCFDSIQNLMVRLKGMNSSKRKEALRRACERVSIEFRTVKLPCRVYGEKIFVS